MRRHVPLVLATVVFLVLAIAGRMASPVPARVYLLDLACLALAWWVPARVMTSAREVARRWPFVLACILGATVLWDAGLSLAGSRRLLAGWYIVYPTSVLVFGLLLLAGGGITSLLGRWLGVRGGSEATR